MDLHKDVMKISGDLVHLFKLKISGTEEIGQVLHRWLDFRLRYIDPSPRRVILSSKFPKKIPKEVSHDLNTVFDAISSGLDINKLQSKSLFYNDSGSKNKKLKTDLMWADWGIHHLHVLNFRSILPETVIQRSKWQIFGVFLKDYFLAIDLRPHADNCYSELEIVESLIRDFPDYSENFELKGMLVGKEKYSSDQHRLLRHSGINAPIYVEDIACLGPGLGFTTAGTALRVGACADKIGQCVADIKSQIENGISEIDEVIKGIEYPALKLVLSEKGVGLFEESLDVVFTPQKNSRNPQESFVFLNDIFYPDWVHEKINTMLNT